MTTEQLLGLGASYESWLAEGISKKNAALVYRALWAARGDMTRDPPTKKEEARLRKLARQLIVELYAFQNSKISFNTIDGTVTIVASQIDQTSRAKVLWTFKGGSIGQGYWGQLNCNKLGLLTDLKPTNIINTAATIAIQSSSGIIIAAIILLAYLANRENIIDQNQVAFVVIVMSAMVGLLELVGFWRKVVRPFLKELVVSYDITL
jgi:hypothetical protein